jgi:hypothetical protein
LPSIWNNDVHHPIPTATAVLWAAIVTSDDRLLTRARKRIASHQGKTKLLDQPYCISPHRTIADH